MGNRMAAWEYSRETNQLVIRNLNEISLVQQPRNRGLGIFCIIASSNTYNQNSRTIGNLEE